ncbi:MAG: hypothetical protein AAGH79_01210 [Bacteroidota bacterium]
MSFSEYVVEDLGKHIDLEVIHQLDWLGKAVVETRVVSRKGLYWILVVYTNPQTPQQVFLRWIQCYPTARKAEIAAGLFKRTIQRDPRGNAKIKQDDFNLCLN